MNRLLIIGLALLLVSCSDNKELYNNKEFIDLVHLDSNVVALGFRKTDESSKREGFVDLPLFGEFRNPKGLFSSLDEDDVEEMLQGKDLSSLLSRCTTYTLISYDHDSLRCSFSIEAFSFLNDTESARELFNVMKRYDEKFVSDFSANQLLLLFDKDTFIRLSNHCHKLVIDENILSEIVGTSDIKMNVYMRNNFNY